MSNFSNYKKFENVGIRSSNDTLIVMDSSNNNISLHSSDGGDDNVDTLSIKNIINKSQNEDLNLSSLNGTTINPVITINNNHGDCRIKTNLNVIGNLNITKNLIIPTHSKTSNLLANIEGSIYYNTSENMYEGYSQTEGWQPLGGFSKTKDAVIHKNLNVIGNINLTNEGMIKTTGIGSFGSITTTGNSSFNSITTTGSINTSSYINCQSITTNNQDINAGSGTVTANTFSGNATTATKLANIVTIGGVNFDGSGSINLPGVNTTGTQNTSGSANTITGTVSTSKVTGLGNASVNYAYRAAVRHASGATLVDTSSQQQLSGKRFSGSHPTGFSSGYNMSQEAAPAGRKSYIFNGGSFTVNYDGQVLYQSGTSEEHDDYNLGGSSTSRTDYPELYYNATLCAIFQKSIHIEENLYIGCDKRNKHNIKEINDSLALDILRKINVYTFYFNDVLAKPYKKQFNVLAQEVKKILPEAVSKHKGYLANIMKVVKVQFIDIEDNKTKMIVETPIEEIVDGINVKFCCLYEDNEFNNVEELVSTSNRKLNLDKLKLKCIENNNTFITDRIDNWQKYTTIVCYGTEDIVLSVDKQIIYSLCHSGIQELDRQQIADKERITNLETKANTLEIANQQQQTKINTLETEVSTLKTENTELKLIIDKLKTANSFEEFKQTF